MNELYHHGIKGMHWGVRRYQNPDGTYTDAGKRREQAREDRIARKEAKQQRISNAKNSALLSDEELTTQILRLQREKQLKDLTAQTVAPGRKHAKDLLERYGDQAIGATVATFVGVYATKKLGDKLNPQKSELERRRETLDAEQQLIKEGYYTIGNNGKLKRTGKGKHSEN